MTLIIFEGLPGSGKTTLIKRISKNLKLPSVGELVNSDAKYILPKESELKGINFFLKSDLLKYSIGSKKSKSLVLIDRGTYSTMGYNLCSKKEHELKAKKNMAKINKKYDDKCIYIYIRISPSISQKRKIKKENKNDLWSFPENLKKINSFYDKVFFNKNNVIVVDGSLDINTIQGELEYLLETLA